jgi:hypothetical protein
MSDDGTTAGVAAAQAAPPTATPGATTQEPQLLAGKYKTPQELEQGYIELQKKFSSTRATTDGGSLALPKAPVLDDNATTQDVIKSAGLDPIKVRDEFMKDGKLSDESYAALKGIGIPRATVNEVFAATKALADQIVARTREAGIQLAGSTEKVDLVLQWAKANLSEPEKTAYQSMQEHPESAVMAFETLLNRYNKAIGGTSTGTMVQGTGGNASAGPATAFATKAEAFAAQRDPRYKTDDAYTRAVQARLLATPDSVLTKIA